MMEKVKCYPTQYKNCDCGNELILFTDYDPTNA